MKMEWNRLLSPMRIGTYGKAAGSRTGDLRSEFEKDYHRIIGSSSFRRLQDKTQVFALDKSDFIRTRLTHSLEVSSFANLWDRTLPSIYWRIRRMLLLPSRQRRISAISFSAQD